MGILGPRCALFALIVATVGAGSVTDARADVEPSNGWGVVPGFRVGAVRATVDGSLPMVEPYSAWGHTTEYHVDVLRTFGGDRRAFGLSLGWLSQTHGEVSEDEIPSVPDAFVQRGVAATFMLSTLVGARSSLALRAGLVGGKIDTAVEQLDGMWRLGLELSRIWKAGKVLDLAGHVAVEYFAGRDDDASYDAVSFVLGATVVFAAR